VTDPAQRRARYALLSGMWAFFFIVFSVPQLSLLLGALALYWGISSLRAKPKPANPAGQPGAGATAGQGALGQSAQPGQPGGSGAPATKPQFATAMSGLVAGGLSVLLVLGMFSLQLVYRDYFTCVSDSLTSAARQSCSKEIPSWLERTVGVKNCRRAAGWAGPRARG
jgi:hypothetical protein